MPSHGLSLRRGSTIGHKYIRDSKIFLRESQYTSASVSPSLAVSEIWFTADHHFCHKNIIKYCNRPFANVREMDETMIRKWDTLVQREDTVYHLGDFAFASKAVIAALLQSLNGRKILLKGNHDGSWARQANVGWHHVSKAISTKIGDIWIDMAHSPLHFEDANEFGYVLCGHAHEKWKMKGRILNVGVDQWDFYPVHLQQVKEMFQ